MPGYMMVLSEGQFVFMPVVGSDSPLGPSQSIRVKFLSKQILISKRYDSFVFCKIQTSAISVIIATLVQFCISIRTSTAIVPYTQ